MLAANGNRLRRHTEPSLTNFGKGSGVLNPPPLPRGLGATGIFGDFRLKKSPYMYPAPPFQHTQQYSMNTNSHITLRMLLYKHSLREEVFTAKHTSPNGFINSRALINNSIYYVTVAIFVSYGFISQVKLKRYFKLFLKNRFRPMNGENHGFRIKSSPER